MPSACAQNEEAEIGRNFDDHIQNPSNTCSNTPFLTGIAAASIAALSAAFLAAGEKSVVARMESIWIMFSSLLSDWGSIPYFTLPIGLRVTVAARRYVCNLVDLNTALEVNTEIRKARYIYPNAAWIIEQIFPETDVGMMSP
jgi:hypothetical protein